MSEWRVSLKQGPQGFRYYVLPATPRTPATQRFTEDQAVSYAQAANAHLDRSRCPYCAPDEPCALHVLESIVYREREE
jgi:hypothetical protein